MDAHRHSGSPTEIEQHVYDSLIVHTREHPGSVAQVGVNAFRTVTLARLDRCRECIESVVEQAVEKPPFGAVVVALCQFVLDNRVGHEMQWLGMTADDVTAAPFIATLQHAMTLAETDPQRSGSIWGEVEATRFALEGFAPEAVCAYVAAVIDHAAFVCDESRWASARTDTHPVGHPFLAYAEHLRNGGTDDMDEVEDDCVSAGVHEGVPSRIERRCHADALALVGADPDASRLAGVEDFQSLTRSRLDYCRACSDRVIDRAVIDPVRATVVLWLCLQVLELRVGSKALLEGMGYSPETAEPLAAITAATVGDLSYRQIEAMVSVVADLDPLARLDLLDQVVQQAGFVCDTPQRHADQSHRPVGHPFRIYDERLRAR